MGTLNHFIPILMSQSKRKVVEGVFAIDKPPAISSAQVIRNLQHIFNPSKLFAPWLARERGARLEEERDGHRNRRKDKRIQVKIGHGGTLDPMATGVLIMGVGKGTKQLQGFLECTKIYEATVLFGAATDTYDVLGKVLRKAQYEHITRESVEAALQKFRGKIMQRPPIYSALRVQGKRLYEYAREGKEVPKEIEKRPVEVKELEILEWLEGGTHQYKWPEEEAEPEAKEVAEKVLHLREVTANGADSVAEQESSTAVKRKRPLYDVIESPVSNKKPAFDDDERATSTVMSGGLDNKPNQWSDPTPQTPAVEEFHEEPYPFSSSQGKSPPAVKLRMTVTSGFYVRSLAHDLGEAVGSLATMSALVRTRQGEFELGKNVLEYEDVNKGEEVWGPNVETLLDAWEGKEEKAN